MPVYEMQSQNKKQLSSNDKFEVDALNTLSEKNIDSFPQVSYDLALRALKLSVSIRYKRGEGMAQIHLGSYYYREVKYLEAVGCFLAAMSIGESNNYLDILTDADYGMAIVSMEFGRKERVLDYIKREMSYDAKKSNIEHLVANNIRLGQLLYEEGDTSGTFRHFFYAFSLKHKLVRINSQIGLYKSIGNLYLSEKKYDIALFYYREALIENQKDVGNLNGTLTTLMAHTYEQKNELNKAFEYYQSALRIRLRENDPSLITSSLINLGHIYFKLGHYDSSFYYTEKGLKNANAFKLNHYRASGFKNLYEFYLTKKEWKNALFALQDYSSAEVLIENEKSKDQIALFENNRIVSEKEKQVEDLQNENAIQKLEMKNRDLLVLLLISLFILMVAIVIYIQQLLLKNKKAKKIVEEINDQLQEEIKEQVVQNVELAKREQEYRFIADNTADLVTLLDGQFQILYISPSSQSFLGYRPEELMNVKDFRNIVHPNSLTSFNMEFNRMLEYSEPTRFIYQVVKKNGAIFWVESNVNPIFNSPTGELQAMLSITRDVTSQIDQEEALMEAAKQKELLIKEVHHRVKNNLAILASLVNMQKSEVTDHKTLDIFSDLQFRVKAMSLVHEELYKSRNIEVLPVKEYLTKLVGIVSSAFTYLDVKIHMDIYDEIVDVEITLPLGLIVNELLTNSFKYAFTDNKEGNIWVTYEKASPGNESRRNMRCLTVRDDGKGLPDNFDISKKTSMGSQIIYLLSRQLNAELHIDGKHGANFSLFFPLER
jgi:PAS domain S-box-containing protein